MMSDFKDNLNFVIEQYQKIQDYVIKTGLYKDKLNTQSHSDLVLIRIKELELTNVEWISAEDRLPQKYQQVIACGTWVGEICGAKEKDFIGMGEWDGSVVNMQCDTYGCVIANIIAWMPRPDLPNLGDDDD